MKNKYLGVIIIIGIVLVSIVGTVVAQNEIPTVSSEGFSLISWFKHTFNIQDFTIVGQDRDCDVFARKTFYFDRGGLMDVSAADAGCSYALINVFNQNWDEIGEWKDDFKAYCGSTGCIVEIYCCPHPECSSDSQCENWEGIGSDCKTNYEVDPYMPLLDEFHDPITSYKYCTSSTGNGNGDTPTTLSAVIYDINAPTSVKTGEPVEIEFKVKNNGDTGDYLLEAGIIPKSTAEDWGFSYAGGGFGIFDWLIQQNLECCEGQPNIFAKTTKLTSGEIDTFKINIQQAPYSEIADLCYDNKYWDGTGEYVLYIIMKTGCYPEGKDVTYETRIITVTGEDVGDGNGDINGNGEELEEGEEPSCRSKEEIFYTNAEGTFKAHSFLIGSKEPITPQRIDEYVPGFSGKYFEVKAEGCCKEFESSYVDTKQTKVTLDILLGLIGGKTADFSYDVYKCVPEGEAGFCLESAHKLLNKYTKTDDCQTNTLISIFLIIGGFIIVLRFTG